MSGLEFRTPRPYYHAVAFDFDGTVVPTMQQYADIAARNMAARFGVPEEAARHLYLETSGIPFFQQLEVIFGPDERNAKCATAFEKEKADYLCTVELSSVTLEALALVRELGLSLAITSNNFQSLLDRFFDGYPGLFDLVLGFQNGLNKGPTQFSRVRNRFGVDRRHLLFVGDSLTDVRKAMVFGLDFVAIAGTIERGGFEAVYPEVIVVDHLTEVVDLLRTGRPIGTAGGNTP